MYAMGSKHYAQINRQTGVEGKDSHQLITLLMDGVVDRVSMAKGHVQRNEVDKKGQTIGAAINILGGLQASLNMEEGGELAERLNMLYDYMAERLFVASKDNDVQALDEVGRLMSEIRVGWNGIRPQIDSGEVPLPQLS